MSTALVSKDSLASESQTWAEKAAGLRVTDAPSCIDAGNFLRSVKGLRQAIQSWFAPHLEAAMETKRKAELARKALADEQARMEAPLIDAETRVKRALLTYETEQEQARIAEERRLQEDARQQAEALTLAAAASMELEAHKTGDVGLMQEAEDILNQPIDAPVVRVETTVPKVKGVVYRDNWRPHPDADIKALAAAVVAGTAPITFLAINWPAVNAFAKATKGNTAVPGIKFYNDRQIAAKA